MSILAPRNEPIMTRQRTATATHSFLKARGANYGRATRRIRVQRGTMAQSSSRSSTRRARRGWKGYLSTAEQEVICFNVAIRPINNVYVVQCVPTYGSRLTYPWDWTDDKIPFSNWANQGVRTRRLNVKWIRSFIFIWGLKWRILKVSIEVWHNCVAQYINFNTLVIFAILSFLLWRR